MCPRYLAGSAEVALDIAAHRWGSPPLLSADSQDGARARGASRECNGEIIWQDHGLLAVSRAQVSRLFRSLHSLTGSPSLQQTELRMLSTPFLDNSHLRVHERIRRIATPSVAVSVVVKLPSRAASLHKRQ
jgi:hypothetical protein